MLTTKQNIASITGAQLTMEDITEMVSNLSGLSIEQIKGKSQKPDLVCARNICFYFIREFVRCMHGNLVDHPKNIRVIKPKVRKMPLKKIARFFHRDHTTVRQNLITLKNLLETGDKQYTMLFEQVKNKIAKNNLSD